MSLTNPTFLVDTTFGATNISSAATVYTYTAAVSARVQFQVLLNNAAGNGDYVCYLSHAWLGASTDTATVLGKATFAAASGETCIEFLTIPIYVKATDTVAIVVDGLAGDTAVVGRVRVIADNFSTLESTDIISASDVWAAGTRTLTAMPALASTDLADIWTYTTRTLTSSAAATVSAVVGSDLTITRWVDFAATISGLTIPAAWTKLYFTVKHHLEDTDAQAVLQIVESNPAAGTDGTLYVEGAAATVAQQGYGSLTVNQAGGTVAIAIADDLTAALADGVYTYDLKVLTASTSTKLAASANCTVTSTETRTV